MTKFFRFLSFRFTLYIFFFLMMLFLDFECAVARVNSLTVDSAITREVCFETFWSGYRYFRLGKTITIFARNENNTTYVLTYELSLIPNVHQMTDFFTIVSVGREAIVKDHFGLNADTTKDTRFYKKKIKDVFGSGTVNFRLKLPTDCTPKFWPDSQLKLLMLASIKSSLVHELAMPNSSENHYRSPIKITIANFNIYDPGTFAFIPRKNLVFSIALHDSDNPFSNTYLQRESFSILDVSSADYKAELIPKIRKYGKNYWIP